MVPVLPKYREQRFFTARLFVPMVALLWAGIAVFACTPARADDADLFQRINREVNGTYRASIPYPSDPDGVWDCENYVNEKAARLEAAGISPARLQRFAVKTRRGVPHGVLVVDGVWVLDNLSPWVTPRSSLNYTDWQAATVFWTAQLR